MKCYWTWNETRKSLFANVKLVRVCYLQIRNVIGHGVKLVKSLLFANVHTYFIYVCTFANNKLFVKCEMLLATGRNSSEFVICKCETCKSLLFALNVNGHGVKLVKSLLFANVKCYEPRSETR